MRCLTALLSLLIWTPTLSAQNYDFSKVDRALQGAFHGNVIVLTEQRGQRIYRFQSGQIDENTKVHVRSASKWVAGAAVLALAEKDYFSLDDPVGTYLSNFEANGKGHFTIRQAFSMSSSLFDTGAGYTMRDDLTLDQIADRIADNVTFKFGPGTKIAYEQNGIHAVARIAEIVTGKEWRTIVREQILDKCGIGNMVYPAGANPAPAHGLITTANEFMKFLRMVVNNGVHDGQTVLSKASINEMFTNQTNNAPIYSTFMPHHQPDYAYGADTLRYAFGVWIFAEHPGTKQVDEICGVGGLTTYPWVDRRRNLVGITMSEFVNPSMSKIVKQLEIMRLVREAIDRVTD
jgi:CubicO group peptidase (beta-lactamase class C family)